MQFNQGAMDAADAAPFEMLGQRRQLIDCLGRTWHIAPTRQSSIPTIRADRSGPFLTPNITGHPLVRKPRELLPVKSSPFEPVPAPVNAMVAVGWFFVRLLA